MAVLTPEEFHTVLLAWADEHDPEYAAEVRRKMEFVAPVDADESTMADHPALDVIHAGTAQLRGETDTIPIPPALLSEMRTRRDAEEGR